MKKILGLLTLVSTLCAFSQNLSKQRIWKITTDKRSIYFDQGIFHSEKRRNTTQLVSIRNSYVESRGFERIVFDFAQNEAPKVYGHISKDRSKLYIDLFNTSLSKKVNSIKNVKFVDSVDFFNIDKDLLSIELNVSKKVSYDIFYLENPGRIVIDIKK